MRKLSTIIALALIITIGGVFAIWHYAQDEVSLETTITSTMADVKSDTQKGTITVVSNNLSFSVDDLGTTDWKAELVKSGSLVFKFEPTNGADADVVANGIKLQATITIAGLQNTYDNSSEVDSGDYKEITVFSTKTGDNTIEINGGNPTKDTNITITAEDIANCLIFNEGTDVYLRTYANNIAYETALTTYTITVTISEIA